MQIAETKPRLNVSEYFTLAWSEPFRLLFPLGIIMGIIGVLLWPVYYTGWTPLAYPVPHHAHIMIQGFFGSFVFGFLGTALPRMLTAPTFKAPEVCLIIGLQCLSVSCHLMNKVFWGDLSFLLTLIIFAGSLSIRFVAREDVPPPGFVLVLFGWLSAITGTAILVASSMTIVPVFWDRLGHLLLYQGFLLFPILGIGAYFFPRFFELPNRHDFDESRSLPPGWRQRAILAVVCGLIVMLGFILEAKGMLRIGPALRLVSTAFYLKREVPFLKSFRKHGTMGVCIGTALILLMTGMLFQALLPNYPIAMEHIVLMGGFSLVAVTVATRVILGHSGQEHRFKTSIRPLTILMFLVLAALFTRLSADLFPSTRISHHIYAAILWATAIITWALKILPGVLLSDDDE